ncbi:MAG: hypothetical protein ACRCXN_07580 [Bacteroidales bacterium]
MTIYFKTQSAIDRAAEKIKAENPHYDVKWGTIICDCGKTPGYTITDPLKNDEIVIIYGWCGSCYRNSSDEFRGE